MKPINGHILIEPLKEKSFFSPGTYQEIGIVLEIPQKLHSSYAGVSKYRNEFPLEKGDKVFFDSWLAAKYPKPNAEGDDDFYWLVKFDDIRAIEHGD